MTRVEAGRSPFDIERPAGDFSGMSFRDLYMVKQSRPKSFFNGVDFTNCGLESSDLTNCEFSEASFVDCEIRDCALDASDFVDSVFENCEFESCTFNAGEWRRSRFRSCHFSNCSFKHTTIALTEFYFCHFCEKSTCSLQHRSIYFNVFSECVFAESFNDDAFISRNFGVPSEGIASLPVSEGALLSLEQLCLIYNRGKMRVVDLVELIESTLGHFDSVGRRRGSTFEFIRLIVRAITLQRKISPSSLVFIETLVTTFAAGIDDPAIFHSAMAFVVEIRSLLFEIAAKEITADFTHAREIVEHVTISFEENFSRQDAEMLARSLTVVGRFSPASFKIVRFTNGSTLIEMATTGIMSLGPLLVGVNFVLRQATVTVQRYGKLKRAVHAARSSNGREVAKSRRSVGMLAKTKVRAVVMDSDQLQELEATRTVVRQSGRKLVELDTKADINVVTQKLQLRR